MVSIPKVIGAVSCSAVLFLSLSNSAEARMSTGPCPDRIGGQPSLLVCDEATSINTVKGDVLRVEGYNYFIERFDGKKMWLHADQTTKMIGHVGRGDRIEAKVDKQEHVLVIRPSE